MNQEADRLHQAGLVAEHAGRYEWARQLLRDARFPLLKAGTPQAEDILQLAWIDHDGARNKLHNGQLDEQPTVLQDAQIELRGSLEKLAPFESGLRPLPLSADYAGATPKAARRELMTVHGSTLSLLGRLATARQVTTGLDTRGDSDGAKLARNVEQQPYGAAYDKLRQGNSGYRRVSHALYAARQERLNGRLPNMAVWLGRGAISLAWTAAFDGENLASAARRFAFGLLPLRSYRAARQSVIRYP